MIGDVPYGSSALTLLPRLIGAINAGPDVRCAMHDSHDYRVDVTVPWMSTYYGVTSPPNLPGIIVDRSIENDIDYLKLKIDPKSKSVFSWEQVFVPIAP